MAHADSITTAAGSGADAYVISGSPTSNFGTATDLQIKNDGDGSDAYNRKAYLRFDLSQLTSFSHNAGSSSLTLTYDGDFGGTLATTGTATYALYGLTDGQSGDLSGGWTETGITWNNAPSNNTSSSSGFTAGATQLGTASIASDPAAGATLTFSSAALAAFLNADTNNLVTLMVVRTLPAPPATTNGYLDFASKENASFAAPTLSVIAAPLPSSLVGCLALGSLLVAFRFRPRRPKQA